jgi:hypothetical protein
MVLHKGVGMRGRQLNVPFSNRPLSSTSRLSHRSSVDVARGLSLLFGPKALSSWDSKPRWNNLPCLE